MFWGNINTGVGSFSNTEGARKTFPLFKGRGFAKKNKPFLGGAKGFGPAVLPFSSPPPRN